MKRERERGRENSREVKVDFAKARIYGVWKRWEEIERGLGERKERGRIGETDNDKGKRGTVGGKEYEAEEVEKKENFE